MHDTAYETGRAFLEAYQTADRCRIVEIGSMNVNGTLKDHARAEAVYIGLDVAHGNDVDFVIDPRQPLPLRSAFADIVVSSSQMEHDIFFWSTFLEMIRIVKDGGYVYVSAPSNGYYHCYPLDCWRFYPDAGIALVQWARHNGYRCTLVESFTAHRKADVWNDFVAIFQKCDEAEARAAGFLSDTFPVDNVHKLGGAAVSNEFFATEDMRMLQAAEQTRHELAQVRSAYESVKAEVAHLQERETALVAEVAQLQERETALVAENARLSALNGASRDPEALAPAEPPSEPPPAEPQSASG